MPTSYALNALRPLLSALQREVCQRSVVKPSERVHHKVLIGERQTVLTASRLYFCMYLLHAGHTSAACSTSLVVAQFSQQIGPPSPIHQQPLGVGTRACALRACTSPNGAYAAVELTAATFRHTSE
eukprot:960107-Pleurochrysis_carterae.AAC.2